MRVLMTLSAAFVPLVAGCEDRSAAPPPGSKGPLAGKTIAFSQIGAESDWRTAETRSMKEEAAKRGVNYKVSDAMQKQEEQIAALRRFIAQGVDAIILAPIVETGWEPVLQEAKRRKIPVVLVDRGIKVSDDSLYATLIASDFVAEGRMAGAWLAEKLGGKGSVVELQGTPGAAPAIDRKKGFEEALAKHPGLRIIKSQSGDFNEEGGKRVMEAFLAAAKSEGTKIDAVYAHNDNMALGAIKAIEEASLKPGQDILIVSIDGIRRAYAAMLAGKLNCIVECNPRLGPAAFDAVEKILAGQTPEKWTVVQDEMFDASQPKEVLQSRGF
jgi:simple sugar transport system substrate-binding protein